MTQEETAKLLERVVVNSGVQGGRPVIRGTRVPVARVVGALSGGASFAELRDDYSIADEDILAALAYAAKVIADG